MATVLIVEDDKSFRDSLAQTINDLGHAAKIAKSGEEALQLLSRDQVDLAFLDLRMPGMDGLEVLRAIRSDDARAALPVVVVTAFADSTNTIEAMKLGAFDHLTKPIGRKDVAAILERALQRPRETTSLPSAANETLIGSSPAMREVQKLIGLAATTDVTVLVLGETGTGKELVARAIHQHSQRSRQPFVAVNCAAIPTDLLESELFGHVRGAFTGALRARTGKFREANRGTLFLDEIGDMTLAMQAKLLRVLQDRIVTPLGGSASEQVDVRIIAASNRDFAEMVRDGSFREDLFYRLKMLSIALPPLRDRGADILVLAEHFLRCAASDAPKKLSAAAAQALLDFDCPGNVRQLENLMRSLSVTVRGPVIDRSDLQLEGEPITEGDSLREILALEFRPAIARLEKLLLQRALEQSGGNRAEAARRLGIHRQFLYAKLKEHGLEV